MAIEVQLFDGTVLEFPEGTDQSVIDRVAKQETTARQTPEEPGIFDRVGAGAERMATSIGTGITGIFGSEDEAAQAAKEGAAEQERIARELGPTRGFDEVAEAYDQNGILSAAGEFVSQVPGAVAEQVPQIAGTLAGAKLGAMAGSVAGPFGSVVGGALGAGVSLFPQMFGANLEEQAALADEEQRELDLNRRDAAIAATGQTAIESVGLAYTLGRNVVGRMVGKEVGKEVAERKLLEEAQRSLAGGAVRGAARGTSEVPVEVAQAVLSRWQSGQDLLSDDAIEEYGYNAYGALQVGPVIGAAASPFERGAARSTLAERGLTPEGETIQAPASQERREFLRQEQQTAAYMREVEMQEMQERQQQEEAQRIQNAQEAQAKVDELAAKVDEVTVEADGLTDRLDALYGVKDNLQILKDTLDKDKATKEVRQNLNERLKTVNAKIDEGQKLAKTIGVEPVRRARLAREAVRNLPPEQRARAAAAVFESTTPEQGILRAVGAPQPAAVETPASPFMTKNELVDIGLPENAGYTKQLAKLNLFSPKDRTTAADIIGRAVENPRVKPEVKEALQKLYQDKLAIPVPEAQQGLPFDQAPETEPSTVISDATFDELGIGRTAVLRKSKDVVGLDYSDPENAAYLRRVFEAYRDSPNRSESIKEKIDAFLERLPQVETTPEATPVTTPVTTPEATGVPNVTEPTTVEPTPVGQPSEPSVGMVDMGDGTTAAQETAPGGVAGTELGGLATVDERVEPDTERGESAPTTIVETPGTELRKQITALQDAAKALLDKRGRRPRRGTAKAQQYDDLNNQYMELRLQEDLTAKIEQGTGLFRLKNLINEVRVAVNSESTNPEFTKLAARLARANNHITDAQYQDVLQTVQDNSGQGNVRLLDMLTNRDTDNDVVNAVDTLRADGDMAGAVTPELETALNAGDVQGALRAIIDNDTAAFNDVEQLIAKRSLDESARPPTLRMVDSLGVDAKGNAILGQYNSITDEISLVRGTGDSHTFLHELTHAFVHRTIIEQQRTGARKPAFRDLQNVYDFLKEKHPELSDDYGMQSLTEFASEVMSNRDFQMKLMGIEYQKQSVFSWFARALRNLMGLNDAGPVGNTLFSAMVAVDGLMHTGRELQIASKGTRIGEMDTVNVTAQAKQNVDTPLGQPLPRTLAEVNRASDQVVRTELNKFAHSYANNETGFATIFRQQAVDILAPISKKINTAFSNGVKNEFGDVNPLIWMRQAFDHQRISLQVFQAGGIRMIKDGTWEAFDLKDSNGKPVSAKKIVETIRDFAKREGTSYAVMKGRIATVLEGMRLKDLREHNAKIEAEAKELAAQGDIDGAFERRQDKLFLHKTNAEIDALVDIFNKTPEIQEVQRIMNAVRGNLIEAMVKSGRITQDQADAWRAAVNYVPFDRLKEIGDNPEIIFGTGRRGIAALARLPEFDGSLDRPVANTIDNFMNKIAWMTEQSMRNSAVTRTLNTMVDAGFARKLNTRNQAQNTHLVLTMYENGEPVLFELQNEYDLAAFLQSPEPTGAVMNAFSGASRLLRTTVTATPMFAIKQVIDDAQRAMFYSGVRNPLAALGRTLINLPRILIIQNFGKNKQVVENLERSGVVGDYDFNPINPAETLELDSKARKRSPVRALIHAMEKVTKASDMAARLAVYEQTMKETGDITLAHNRARELINFNRRGASKFMRAMTHIVPFFNSWAQGTDLMYRGFTGEDASSGLNRRAARNMFISRIAFMTGMGFLYASLMSEDEAYQETSDEVRDRAWVLPKQLSDAFGMNQPFKFSVPIELGFLFKSIPERTVQYFNEHAKGENKPALDAVLNTFRDAAAVYGMEPIPAILRPALENLTNYSFFNHRALVPPSLQNAPKELQFTSSTSEFAKKLGEQTNTSPILIDNAMRGYFGLMWSSSSVMIDSMMNPVRPDRNLNQLPFLSIGLMAPVGTRTKDEFYEFREKVTAAVNGKNRLAEDPERQQKFIEENQGLLAAAPYVNQKLKQLRELRAMKKMYESPVSNMSGEQRREVLDELKRLENGILSDIREVRNYYMQ